MQSVWVFLMSALCFGACSRPEEPSSDVRSRWVAAPSDAKAPPSASTPSPTRKPIQLKPRCIAPWPGLPPKPALPATECPSAPEPAAALPTGSVTFVDAPGNPTVDVEVARTPAHRARGLMYRTHLEPDQGMIFSWEDEQPRSFWMHNTCIPLDMLFVAKDGTVVGILEQVPPLNEESRRIPCPAAHVIEVVAGWARNHGVQPGQHVQIDA